MTKKYAFVVTFSFKYRARLNQYLYTETLSVLRKYIKPSGSRQRTNHYTSKPPKCRDSTVMFLILSFNLIIPLEFVLVSYPHDVPSSSNSKNSKEISMYVPFGIGRE